MNPNIGIAEKDRKAVAKVLNDLLADEIALYIKTRNFHWNIVGPEFNDLHKFYEGQYEALDEILDDVAERARSIGSPALGSLKELAARTRLKEAAGAEIGAKESLKQLLADHETIIRQLREDHETAAKHNDAGTDDFLVGLIEEHEKMAWMLRSFQK